MKIEEGRGMIKNYSTGEIIDILKPGQGAKDVFGYYYDIFMDKHGRIYHTNGNRDKGTAELTPRFMKAKWQLLPQYIPFEEARKALLEGKTVEYYDEERNIVTFFKVTNFGSLEAWKYNENNQKIWDNCSLGWKQINGNWSVMEADTE